MKILVPTDFSPLAEVGVLYAAELCAALNAEMILINVFFIDAPTRALADFTTEEVIQKRRDERLNEGIRLIENVRNRVKGDFKAHCTIRPAGPVAEVIAEHAIHARCDLIVMSTKGAGAIKRAFFGSNTASVIQKSSVPVLAIPEFAFYRGIRDLVYASDLSHLPTEMEAILPLAKPCNARIHVLHIHSHDAVPELSAASLESQLRTSSGYEAITCHYMIDNNVRDGIIHYAYGKNVDVLVMFSAKRGFFERLFEKSATREIVFDTKIPLLAFNKTNTTD